jgi:hypothetical protein
MAAEDRQAMQAELNAMRVREAQLEQQMQQLQAQLAAALKEPRPTSILRDSRSGSESRKSSFMERWNRDAAPLLEEAKAAGWADDLKVGTAARPTPVGAVKRPQPKMWTGKGSVLHPRLWMKDMLACWGTPQETLKRMGLNLADEPRVRWDALVTAKWGGDGWEERMPWEDALKEFERLEGFDPRAAQEEALRALLAGEVQCLEVAGCQKYITEFRQKEVFAPAMDEGTKIRLFIMGLQGCPDLYKACARQADGTAWPKLSTLMDYALQAANTLRAVGKGVKRPAALALAVGDSEDEDPAPDGKKGALAFTPQAGSQNRGRTLELGRTQDRERSQSRGRNQSRGPHNRSRSRSNNNRAAHGGDDRRGGRGGYQGGSRGWFGGTCDNCDVAGHKWKQCRKPLKPTLQALADAAQAAKALRQA